MAGQDDDKTQTFVILSKGMMTSHYRIIDKIGAGGMGEVYLAEDTRLKRKVALKFLSAVLCADEGCRKRFALEAQAAARLDHPNIVTIYEVGEFAGRPYLSMQYIEGESLREILSKKALTFEETLAITLQICEGIKEAHSKQVVHRDLKPANVVVSPEGKVKILDFGLVKILDGDESVQPGAIVGTVNYMSPEQVDARPLDHRSDIFSIGVLFYEMLTGVNPFTRKSIAATIHAIASETPQDLFTRRHTIPPDCQKIISSALAKIPDDRYKCVADLVHDLEQVRVMYAAASSDLNNRLYRTPYQAAEDQPSIAVLPFVNMSPDPSNVYFADGLSEELLNVLTKVGRIQVAARMSSFLFRDSDKDIRSIGRALNVKTILEGSVRKSDTRVRVSVQLVKVEDGYHIWSETFDRSLDDIFIVQDDIAQTVVQQLRVALLGEKPDATTTRQSKTDVALAIKGRGDNPEAHRLYLRGRYHLGRLTQEDLTKSREYLQRAIEMDPLHALAWAGLSRAFADQAGHGWIPLAEGFEQSRSAAQKALEIEADLAEGHMRMGLIHMSYDWNWDMAQNAVQRALELAPGNASVLRTAAHLASNLNQLDESIRLMRRVVELDPLSSVAYHGLGVCCYSADRLDQAANALKKALEINPKQIGLWFDSSRVQLALGQKENALSSAHQEVFEPFRLLGLAIVHHACGNPAESDSALNELTAKYSEDGAYQIAEALAFKGQAESAFEWLDRAYRQRDPGLPEMRTEPLLRALHEYPRWKNLMEGLGFAR